MENELKVDKEELEAMESELLSEYEDDDDDDDSEIRKEPSFHLDSPYPSDVESDDDSEDEFIVTDNLQDWPKSY